MIQWERTVYIKFSGTVFRKQEESHHDMEQFCAGPVAQGAAVPSIVGVHQGRNTPVPRPARNTAAVGAGAGIGTGPEPHNDGDLLQQARRRGLFGQQAPERLFCGGSGSPSPGGAKFSTTRAETPVRYDFANNYVDGTTFPSVIWRRHLGRALQAREALTGYGEPQGEPVLRQVLAEYSHESRGVVAQPEQIVISAGVQSLFVLLAALLGDRLFHGRRAIAWERPGFAQGEEIFRRQGWDLSHFDVEDLDRAEARLLYVSPSNPYKGRSLTPEQRRRLLRWTREHDGYILEDDYNGEFRYFATPVSSLQGMGDGEHIVYLGSFSRLLFPSLRISYMVLPPGLLPDYQCLARLYNQTSSTVEQLALASFLREGHLRRHVKNCAACTAARESCCNGPWRVISGTPPRFGATNRDCICALPSPDPGMRPRWRQKPKRQASASVPSRSPRRNRKRKSCCPSRASGKRTSNRLWPCCGKRGNNGIRPGRAAGSFRGTSGKLPKKPPSPGIIPAAVCRSRRLRRRWPVRTFPASRGWSASAFPRRARR